MRSNVGVSAGGSFGARVRAARTKRGMSRLAVAELCGRSEEWLRLIERGHRGTSLKMVTRLAEVLRVTDLTDLLGEQAPTAMYARPEHPSLGEVRRALSTYGNGREDVPKLDEVRRRARQAWRIRAVSSRDRSDLAAILPGLLVDAQRASRTATTAPNTRAANRVLADVYHLGQLYLCYQDAPELLWVVADRAMTAAQLSEDPATIARAAWFSAYLYRDFGVIDQAHQVVEDAVRAVEAAEQTPELARQRSVVHLASAWNFARAGQPAQAWHAWDLAVAADRDGADLPAAYVLFGTTCDDVALTLDVELGRSASAARRADAVDVDNIDSVPRKTRLLIEAARGQMLKREHTGAVHLLRRAQQTSPEATLFSAYARSMVHDLSSRVGPMMRAEVAALATDLALN